MNNIGYNIVHDIQQFCTILVTILYIASGKWRRWLRDFAQALLAAPIIPLRALLPRITLAAILLFTVFSASAWCIPLGVTIYFSETHNRPASGQVLPISVLLRQRPLPLPVAARPWHQLDECRPGGQRNRRCC